MPPKFKKIGDLMYMKCLDAIRAPYIFCIGYRFTDQPEDPWTRRFNLFKDKNPVAIAAGARTMAIALSTISFPQPPVVIVSAISSTDTALSIDSPMWVVGSEVVKKNPSWAWQPDLLEKRPHPSLHRISNAAARDAAVSGTYTASIASGAPGTFLIIDDLCTRGSTLADISRALRERNPEWKIYGATLAKTENVKFWEDITNSHIPERLRLVWDEPVQLLQ